VEIADDWSSLINDAMTKFGLRFSYSTAMTKMATEGHLVTLNTIKAF
jgi:hypothetical protein